MPIITLQSECKRLADVFRIGESILWLLYSILIPDRLNCKVWGLISMQRKMYSERNKLTILQLIEI